MEANNNNNNEKKKGFFAALWESMVKTGGCCGNGESCGGKLTPIQKSQHSSDNNQDKPHESKNN